jgi:hypothetical protein
MIIAAMQPYFFPYLGYFQLMAQCDRFILLDDVQYVDRRWMNRNRILRNGAPAWLTYPVLQGPQAAAIRDRHYVGTCEAKNQVLNKVRDAYRRAHRCDEICELIQSCLECRGSSVAEVNEHLLRTTASRLGIYCEFVRSSDLGADPALRGERRILEMCRLLGADEYVNPIGGLALYSDEAFAARGIRLSFLQTGELAYRQFDQPFVPMLSVIDLLIFTDRDLQRELLERCRRASRADVGMSGAS